MHSRIAVFSLFAASAAPLTLESAPAPKVAVEVIIDVVKPPKGMTMEKYRDQQIRKLRSKSVYDLVDGARSNVHLAISCDGGERRLDLSKVLALSIVKKQKGVEALLTKKYAQVERGEKRDIYIRLPAEEEQKALAAWLNRNLQIDRAGARLIRIRFAVGSKSEQAVIINALAGTYAYWGLPHARRGQILSEMDGGREELSNYKRRLSFTEDKLAELKNLVPQNKREANALSGKRAMREKQIASLKSKIKDLETDLQKLQAEPDDLPPEPVIRRWANPFTGLPHAQQRQILSEIEDNRQSLSGYMRMLKREEKKLVKLKRVVPKDKWEANVLTLERAPTERIILEYKSRIKALETRLQELQAELDALPPSSAIRPTAQKWGERIPESIE